MSAPDYCFDARFGTSFNGGCVFARSLCRGAHRHRVPVLQTGRVLQDVSLDPDTPDEAADVQDLDLDVTDEGFEEEDNPTVHYPEPSLQQPGQDHPRAPTPPVSTGEESEESAGPDGQLGYQHVTWLASALVDLRELDSVSDAKVDKLLPSWTSLGPCKLAEPVAWWRPFVASSAACTLPGTRPAESGGRGAAVLTDYTHIRELVLDNPRLMAQTTLQLFELNQRTLSQWFSRRQKERERTVLEQAVVAPSTPAVASQPLPPPWQLLRVTSPARHRRAHCSATARSRTTAWRRRKRRREQGREAPFRQSGGIRWSTSAAVQTAGRQFGHSPFGKVSFCATAAGKSVEEWLAEMKDVRERAQGR
ncbi:hypothetical protein ANANG_G00283750 [Anguilla anguilla]|uniref:Uncharacterized protein n=1 Tax=Anguilla anguilla TaxID=7936 RepID=A0A9D3LK42_ANGAN|nr:hypothetical protein ANANG_G00283750 [Anguilla anguilla]